MSRDDVYKKQKFGQTVGIGKRCGLILVDFVNGFVDPEHFGGPHIVEAVNATVPLLAAFREQGLPVAHTRVVYPENEAGANAFSMKVPGLRTLTETSHISQFVSELTPGDGEFVVRKQGASAFFSTGLSEWLRFRGVDTAIVTGCTTSGCIRATVIDAVQFNFRTIVIEDCVGDRAMEPHEANLFDMRQKYADVMTRDEFLAALASQK